MAFDFPSSPTEGQTFTPAGGPTYRYVDPKWTVLGSSASVEISDTAPASPSPGNLWWEADTGKLFVWYDDGTSQQWVEAAGGGRGPAASGWRNRIINGDFVIDQRNAGALVTANFSVSSYVFSSDRWYLYAAQTPGTITGQQKADATYLGDYELEIKTGVADATLAAGDIYSTGQKIEGYDCRDFYWGNANAKTITISFTAWANTTLTLPLAVTNVAGNRSWLGSFAVTTTPTRFTFIVPGDMTGTWEKGNLAGITIGIGLGIGSTYQGVAGWQAGNFTTLAGMTNFMAAANTLHLKDFQVEVGSVATEFERVEYGDQLRRCQRYYQKYDWTSQLMFSGYNSASNTGRAQYSFPTPMRASPTVTKSGTWNVGNCAQPTFNASKDLFYGLSTITALGGWAFYPDSADDLLVFSAEL